MSQTLDYSKWDKLELSDEEEVQPQKSRGGLRFDTDALQRDLDALSAVGKEKEQEKKEAENKRKAKIKPPEVKKKQKYSLDYSRFDDLSDSSDSAVDDKRKQFELKNSGLDVNKAFSVAVGGKLTFKKSGRVVCITELKSEEYSVEMDGFDFKGEETFRNRANDKSFVNFFCDKMKAYEKEYSCDFINIGQLIALNPSLFWSIAINYRRYGKCFQKKNCGHRKKAKLSRLDQMDITERYEQLFIEKAQSVPLARGSSV